MCVYLVAMATPGITCREVVTAWGTREFAEVFFDDVWVNDSLRLGEVGQGWEIANQLLAYERGPADIGWVARLRRLLTTIGDEVDRAAISGARRDRLAQAHIELRVLELQVRRSLTSRGDGSLPGAEGSLDKLLLTRVDQLVNEVTMELRGASALDPQHDVADQYWMARAASVFGGTSQIQRNIIGERVLHLPR
jgi:alkylation response protein AidB-like acyl-CoA dehydrogenase